VIRVLIVASSEAESAELAELMAEDERIEVVSTDPDVVLAAGLPIGLAASFDAPIVVLTGEALPAEGYGHSVRAHLPLDATASEVLAAVAAVGQGLVVLTQTQAERLLPARSGRDDLPRLIEALTPREVEVLRLLADGLVNKEIADRLGISEHTAKFHVASILGKLQASSRTEAVAQGMRRGLIPI
jgi:DNA-binding NarL/FixJ family response regulator